MPKATSALLCLALVIGLLGTGCQSQPAGGLAIRVSAAHSRLWRHGQVELDLTGAPPAANPFDPSQIDLQVAFSPPQGEPVVVPAFYYQEYDAARRPVGRPGWKARFSPSQSGAWSAQAHLHAGGEIQVSAPIPILVVEGADAARHRGAVRVSQANPRYLAFENGETFTPIGINLGWWNGDPLGDYERWFDALQRNGATVARIWMASWSFGLEWNDTGLGDYTQRLDRAWLLDQVLRMAEQRGIYVIPVLLNHGAFSLTVNPEWKANPYNSALGGPCKTPQDFMTDPGRASCSSAGCATSPPVGHPRRICWPGSGGTKLTWPHSAGRTWRCPGFKR